MTEGPIGFEPKIFSAESLQPLKLMEYPPNAGFFAMPSPPSRWILERQKEPPWPAVPNAEMEPRRPAPPNPAEGIITGLRGREKEKILPLGGATREGDEGAGLFASGRPARGAPA